VIIQPQSGLGDLVFALPQIYAHLAHGEEVTVATNHTAALFGLSSPVKTVTVEKDKTTAKLIPGAKYLRYEKYRKPFFSSYYYDTRLDLETAIKEVRLLYRLRTTERTGVPYVLYAPPRAAHRHKAHGKAAFQCSPNVKDSEAILQETCKNWNAAVNVLKCEDDIYAPGVSFEKYRAVTRCFSIPALFETIANASAVVSQISAITAIAGLYGVPCEYLKAESESENLHTAHVAGVYWPA